MARTDVREIVAGIHGEPPALVRAPLLQTRSGTTQTSSSFLLVFFILTRRLVVTHVSADFAVQRPRPRCIDGVVERPDEVGVDVFSPLGVRHRLEHGPEVLPQIGRRKTFHKILSSVTDGVRNRPGDAIAQAERRGASSSDGQLASRQGNEERQAEWDVPYSGH